MGPSYTLSSVYADLILERIDGGGLRVLIRQHHGQTEGEARINLSPAQVTELMHVAAVAAEQLSGRWSVRDPEKLSARDLNLNLSRNDSVAPE